MCLAVPGQIEEIFELDGLKMASVNFDGVKKSICLAYTPDAVAKDYVLVHVGFAISIIDEEEAMQTLALLDHAGELKELQAEAGVE
jgi:hydrogenase expression/formation protein HypC